MQFAKKKITPKAAEKMLRNNESNRILSPTTVDRYVRMMKSGDWKLNPQPIVLNGNSLLDGQHRLHAVIKHGEPIEFLVCTGADADIRKVIDAGRPRSVNNRLQMEFGVRNASRVSAVARMIHMFETGEVYALNPGEIVSTIAKHKKEFEWVDSISNPKFFRSAAVTAPLAWVYRKYPDEVAAFADGLFSGASLAKTAPELKLRNFILENSVGGGRVSYQDLALRVFAALEYSIDGKKMTGLRSSSESYQRFRRELRFPANAVKWTKAAREKRSRKSVTGKGRPRA